MKEYEMTQLQLDTLLKACEPVPYIIVGGIPPLSPQQRANDAWAALGHEMGFDHFSVKPIAGKDCRFFMARPIEEKRNDNEA
jgi:hypothetical protein